MVDKDVFAVQAGLFEFQPVFAHEHLIDGQCYEVEIVDFVRGYFMIGVAAAELRNKANKWSSNNSICINTYGTVFSDAE